MSRRASSFTQADVTRALRAAHKLGGAWAAEIDPDGTIRVLPAPSPNKKQKSNLPAPVEHA